MEMKLSYGIPRLDTLSAEKFEEYVSFLGMIGYKGIECDICDVDSIDKKVVRKILEKNNMVLAALRTGGIQKELGVSFTDEDPDSRETAKRYINKASEFASEFGAVMLLGRIQSKVDGKKISLEQQEHLEECLKSCADFAYNCGTSFALEPMNHFQVGFNNTTKDAAKFLKKINLDLKQDILLLLDVYHMIVDDPSVSAGFVAGRDLLGHVHFSGVRHDIPSFSCWNFPEYIKILDALDYKGWIGLEVFRYQYDFFECAQASMDYLKPLFNILKYERTYL